MRIFQQSPSAEKCKGDPLGCFNIHCCKMSKLKGGSLETLKIFRKVTTKKKSKGALQSHPVLYVTLEKGITSDLGQMVQFDTLKFCRTL